jgi:hypothetical protein
MTNTTTTPIMVNSTPTPAQIESALRSALTGLGAAATALGASNLAGDFSTLLTYAGPVAMVIGFGLSQWTAYRNAHEKIAMANAAPPSVAMVKGAPPSSAAGTAK